MELTQLNQFKVIAECGKLAKASKELYISSPALSRSVQKLEDELQIELFDRTKNSMVLNEAGKIVLYNAKIIFETIEKMKEDLGSIKSSTAPIRLGSSLNAAMRHFVPFFLKDCPDIMLKTVVLSQHDISDSLINNDIDIALSAKILDDPHIINIPIAEERLTLYAPLTSTFAKRRSISLKELDKQTIVISDNKQYYWLLLTEMTKRYKIKINFINIEDYVIYWQTAENSDLLFISSQRSQALYKDIQKRKHIPFSDKELTITYYVSYLKKNYVKIKRFDDWIRDYYEKIII